MQERFSLPTQHLQVTGLSGMSVVAVRPCQLEAPQLEPAYSFTTLERFRRSIALSRKTCALAVLHLPIQTFLLSKMAPHSVEALPSRPRNYPC